MDPHSDMTSVHERKHEKAMEERVGEATKQQGIKATKGCASSSSRDLVRDLDIYVAKVETALVDV